MKSFNVFNSAWELSYKSRQGLLSLYIKTSKPFFDWTVICVVLFLYGNIGKCFGLLICIVFLKSEVAEAEHAYIRTEIVTC